MGSVYTFSRTVPNVCMCNVCEHACACIAVYLCTMCEYVYMYVWYIYVMCTYM